MASGTAEAGQLDPGLARRLHRALTGSREELFQSLLDPEREVLRAALKNPALGEEHLLALLKRRELPEELLKAVYRLELTQGSHRLKLALAKNPATPGPVAQAVLPQLYLFELVGLCYLPGVTPDQKLAAERIILQRLPVIPLGEKLTLARRGTAAVVGELLREGNPQILEPCLANPHLKEAAIFQFLNSAKATAETISIIARHPRWKERPNLRLAILRNPRTPGIWFTLFLGRLSTTEVRGLLQAKRLTLGQVQLVQAELQRRGV
jgi:hypothetical protein